MVVYVIPVVTFVLGLLIGWQLDKRLQDRQFLRSDVYSPLYEEVRVMSNNISEFRDCFDLRYGRPNHSAPRSADKVPGNVRTSLIQTGKYKTIPQNLRETLDNYYDTCLKDWNLLLDTWNVLQGLREGKITDVEVIDDGRSAIIKYSNERKVQKSSLVGSKDFKRYEGIKLLDEDAMNDKLKGIQQELRGLGEALLKELEDSISDPIPLRRLLPLGRLHQRK